MIPPEMTNPRFQPRRYPADSRAFGRTEQIDWVPVQPGTEDQHLASQFQHDWVVLIRLAARRKYGSLKGYANATGQNYNRVARVMRGEAIMRLEDIAVADRTLGIIGGKPAQLTAHSNLEASGRIVRAEISAT